MATLLKANGRSGANGLGTVVQLQPTVTPRRRRRLYSQRVALIQSSREAVLAAIQIYNNPLITFKTEAFVVLMVIAWTYLLHAYYRSKRIEYRYSTVKGTRRRFERTDGRYRYWELKKCISVQECPLDKNTINNLRFLIGLRDEIEHVRAAVLDTYLSGRYQACALNYNRYVGDFFGPKYALDAHLTFSIQFAELTFEQAQAIAEAEGSLPQRIRTYIAQFDNGLTQTERISDQYEYKLFFAKTLAGKPGQANKVIDFIGSSAVQAEDVPQEQWTIKEVEKQKYLPGDVVRIAKENTFTSFGMHQHTLLWKSEDAKNPAKGYGDLVAGKHWYWYQRWVDFVLEHLKSTAPETQAIT